MEYESRLLACQTYIEELMRRQEDRDFWTVDLITDQFDSNLVEKVIKKMSKEKKISIGEISIRNEKIKIIRRRN